MIMKREKEFNKTKLKESEKGITLIVLVITIIVLLILAAVSIAMLTGENGILSKASNAKEKHLIAQYEEEINLCIMEMQTDELGTLTMPKLIENLPQYIQTAQPGEQYEWDTEQIAEEPTGIYKGYEFKVDKNNKAHITGKATGIMISCSVEPSGYTNQNVTATIKITCNEGIQSIKQTKPTEETTITASGTEYTIVKESIESNTTFEYEVTDTKENTETKIAQITNIDKDAPTSCTITANVNDDGAIEVTATAVDAGSGIGKYECYVNGEKKEENNNGTFKIENLESGTYSVYVIAYDKVGNSKKSGTKSNLTVLAIMKDITAEMVAEHPEKYYGLKVTNYESTNGQDDWRIFYSDGTHIFLITGDYIKNDKIDTAKTGMTISGTYKTWWSNVPDMQTVTSETKKLFMATKYNLNSNNDNSKCISTLLNTNNWNKFKDTENKAIDAIGSPTIEMWTDSWNKLYSNDKIYCNKTDNYGYYLGTVSAPTTSEIKTTTMQLKDGYQNKLYFPYTKATSDGCTGYWISSPKARAKNRMYCWASGNIGVGTPTYTNSESCLRPVVSLNSEIKVNATDAE